MKPGIGLTIVALLVLISVAVAQSGSELDEQYQLNWVTALANAVDSPGLSDYCQRAITQARDGVEFARTKGGIHWCYNCGIRPGYTDTETPRRDQDMVNVLFAQPPSADGEDSVMPRTRLDRPNSDLANVMIHEGGHARYHLRGLVESNHEVFNQRGDRCFQHVTHPVLVPPEDIP